MIANASDGVARTKTHPRMPVRLLAALAQHATLAAICVRILILYSPPYAILLSVLFVVSHTLANRLAHTLFSCSLTFAAACALLFAVEHIAGTCIAILALGFAPVAYPLYLLLDPQAPSQTRECYVHALSVRYRLAAFVALAGSNLGYTLGASPYLFLVLIPVHALIALYARKRTDVRVAFAEAAPLERHQFELGIDDDIRLDDDDEAEAEAKAEVEMVSRVGGTAAAAATDYSKPYREETRSVASSQPSALPEGVTPEVRAFLQATRAEEREGALSDVVTAGQDHTIMHEARRSLEALSRSVRDATDMGREYLAMQLLERRFGHVIVLMILGGLWVATFSLERLRRTPGEVVGPTIVNLLVVALMFYRGRYVTSAYVQRTWRALWVVAMVGTFALLWAPPHVTAYLLAVLEGVGYAATAFFPLEWLVTAYYRSVDPYAHWAWLWTAFHCARVVAMVFCVLDAYQLVLAVAGLWLAFEHLRPKDTEDQHASPHFPLSRTARDPSLRLCGLW